MTDMPEESIFAAAIELVDPRARDAYLAGACGSDDRLRRRVDRLLAAYDDGQFLEAPVADLAARALAPAVGEQPGDTIGPYKLLEQIGEGGMGLVYMAEQTHPLRRRVALKIIKPGLDTAAVIARFEAERQALALMDHPNIAKIYDAGSVGLSLRERQSDRPTPARGAELISRSEMATLGRPYFVMELVRGAPITDYCKGRQLDLRARLELFIDVCHAVQHAHQKGVIHRDLKPTNILVAQSDTAPVPKVIDFGVAKATTQPLTERTLFTSFAQVIGTPLYMSPEQADLGNQDVDTRSDVYSLGVVLYELLTGATPFDAERLKRATPEEMRRIIREEEPPKPSTRATTLAVATTVEAPHDRKQVDAHVTALKGDLDWIVMKALDKDRRRRYESPAALAADIRRHLNDEPIEAAAPTAWYQARKLVRRHRVVSASVATIAVVLVAATAVSMMWALRASRAGSAAIASERTAEAAQKRAEAALNEVETARNQAAWQLYATRMNQAAEAWESHEYGVLQSLLEQTTPTSPSLDFRGWEWHFLKLQYDQAFASTPSGPVWQVAWHPQRTEFAVAVPLSDGQAEIQIWKPDRTTPVRTIAPIAAGRSTDKRILYVSRLVWSADGRRLACSFYPPDDFYNDAKLGNWVSVIEADSGETIFCEEVTNHEDWRRRDVSAIALNSDGTALAIGTTFGQVKLWDAERGDQLRVLHDPESDDLNSSLAFSPQGDYLAAVHTWGRRTVWNLRTGEELNYAASSSNYEGVVRWNPDGSQFAATDEDKNAVVIYKLGEPQPLSTLPHTGVRAMCWIDADVIISAGTDQHVRIWSVKEQRAVQTASVWRGRIDDVDASFDGAYLATWQQGEPGVKLVRLDAALGRARTLEALPLEEGWSIEHIVRWSRDGRRLASGVTARTNALRHYSSIRVYDLLKDRDVMQVRSRIIRAMDWASDDASLLAECYWRESHRISVDQPETSILQRSDGPGTCEAAAISPDGRWIARYFEMPDGEEGESGLIEICDSRTRKVRIQLKHDADGCALNWSPNGRTLFIACWDFWEWLDVPSGKLVRVAQERQIPQHSNCVAWDPTSTFMAAGIEDGSVEIWRPGTSTRIARLIGHQGEVFGLDWSSDGQRIASSASDKSVRIWDASTGDAVAAFHLQSDARVESLHWSPDGRQLAAGAYNGDILLFDAGATAPSRTKAPAASGTNAAR